MGPYEAFASVYDKFMDDVPYDKWCEYIKKIFKRYDKPTASGLVADLGCGTGNMTLRLSKEGFEMIGIDISEQMLAVARQKAEKEKQNILFLNQDMTEFELYGTVDAIVSVCDCINYITEGEELEKVFALVQNYLEPNGLFVFDINTVYKFRHILADNSFCRTEEDEAFTWENYFDEASGINEYLTNFFIKNSDGTYSRYEEAHYEKAYETDEIKVMLERAGLTCLACFEELTFTEPSNDAQRVFFVARKTVSRS